MSLRHKNRPLILRSRVKPFQKARAMVAWEGFCAQPSLGQLVSRCLLVFGNYTIFARKRRNAAYKNHFLIKKSLKKPKGVMYYDSSLSDHS